MPTALASRLGGERFFPSGGEVSSKKSDRDYSALAIRGESLVTAGKHMTLRHV
jgi:hypothetical protein